MSTENKQQPEPAVRRTGLLAELEAELEREEAFVKMLRGWDTRTEIMERAVANLASTRERVATERGHSANVPSSATPGQRL